MPRAGLTPDSVIADAARLLDELGPNAFTLAAVAESLGVRIPSLYKHIDGMPDLQRGITVAAKREFSAAIATAAVGKSREDAMTAIAHAYRAWALAHPGQYPLTVRAPAAGDAADEEVSVGFAMVIFAVLEGYELVERDAIDATRFVRAAMHGFVSLETSGGFGLPIDIDESFERTVEHVVSALDDWTASGHRA